jgi:hypothetical protein
LDTHSGIRGRCDEVFYQEQKPFAVLEAKKVLADSTLRWHRQGRNLCLQLYNSFIGSEAEVGIALVLGGFHIVWREKAKSGISMRSRVGEVQRFNFYRLSMQFSEIRKYLCMWLVFVAISKNQEESMMDRLHQDQEIVMLQENLNQ